MIYTQPLQPRELAISFAAVMHSGQLDKGQQPYIFHPLRVMDMARALGLDIVSQVSGGLHDVIEDTNAELHTVASLFGWEVADTVNALSRRTGIVLVKLGLSESEAESYDEFIDRLLEHYRASKLKLLDIADNMRPDRKVEGLSGLAGRYVRVARKLKQKILSYDFAEDYDFMRNYRKHAPWMAEIL